MRGSFLYYYADAENEKRIFFFSFSFSLKRHVTKLSFPFEQLVGGKRHRVFVVMATATFFV
jgi:hypothetical protein